MTNDGIRWEREVISLRANDAVTVWPILAYRGMVNPSGRFTAAAHPFYTWWWITSGQVELTTPGESRVVRAGEWVFIPYGLWREQRFPADAQIVSLSFLALWSEHLPLIRGTELLTGRAETLPDLLPYAEAVVKAVEQDEPGRIYRTGQMPMSHHFEMMAALYRFINLLFSHVLTRGARIASFVSPDARVEWVIRDLHANLSAGPLPFDRWSEQTKLSRTQLDRLARSHLRKSLAAYRDELLTAAVCRALTTDRPLVKQVAEQFGFCDTAHLCRWLRRQTGHSPAEFQRTAVV